MLPSFVLICVLSAIYAEYGEVTVGRRDRARPGSGGGGAGARRPDPDREPGDPHPGCSCLAVAAFAADHGGAAVSGRDGCGGTARLPGGAQPPA